MTGWSAVAVAVATTVALIVVVRIVARGRAPAPALTTLPFQSGHEPAEHALSRFHARWYPLTLLFLAFDVEMLFMYPWAIVAGMMGPAAVIEMFAFLGVLLAGVLWAWREGALRWV
ncbi:NADH-quinone oxidoreductase subunit A [Promicromonospora sp. NPDC023987]|uniref:NADH-quinone oxidoreductase subunit A n=1 Tax=Promicromonospora sp. NPDC023987 TaxID=3155360 RepID=UPI0033EA341C